MTHSTKYSSSQLVATFILALGLVLGLLMCIFIPYGAGFDEEAHTVRFFEISGLHFVPNQGMEKGDFAFSEFFTLSYQRRYFQSPAWDNFASPTFQTRADWSSLVDGNTRSDYFPLLYLPQALVAGVFWRVFDWPILPGLIAMRVLGFLVYFLLCWLAYKRLPFGKLLFLVLAFSPMALFEAATLNADLMTNAVSFLFIAVVLQTFAQKDRLIDGRRAGLLAGLTLLVGCVKPGAFIVFLILLLLIRHRFTSKKYRWLLLGSVAAALLISLVWSALVVAGYKYSNTDKTLSSQIALVLANLGDFVPGFLLGFFKILPASYKDWVGVYGYWVGRVPLLTYVFFPISIVLAVIAEARDAHLNAKNRVWLFVLGLLCLMGISSYQFVMSYQPGLHTAAPTGRYFVAFAPVLLLALPGIFNFNEKVRAVFAWLTAAAVLATLGFYSLGMYQAYYTICTAAPSAQQPCTLPVYKNLDVDSPAMVKVAAGDVVVQTIVPQCGRLSAALVRVAAVSGSGADTLQFQVLNAQKQVAASQDFVLADLKKNDFLKIPLDLNVQANVQPLYLQFTLVNGSSSNASLNLLARAPGSIYPQGNLTLNKTTEDSDIFFQYECAFK